MRFLFAALLAPLSNKEFMTGSGIIFQFADYRNFFAALLNNMQRQRMKRACGNVFGM